jgi:hypothetical protein
MKSFKFFNRDKTGSIEVLEQGGARWEQGETKVRARWKQGGNKLGARWEQGGQVGQRCVTREKKRV